MMSPNRLLVTITSNCAGFLHHVHRERVDVAVRRLDAGILRRHFA